MKHFIGFWTMILCLHGLCAGQETFVVAGIDLKGSSGNVGITVGPPDYGVISGENAFFVAGVQQPFDIEVATGISDDGQFYYAFNKGTLTKYKLSDGSIVKTFQDIESGGTSGANVTMAADDQYMYTWDPSTLTIHVYDLDGKFVKNLKITNGSYGYSLSYADGYLFVADDGNYSTGTWYGYNIRKLINPTQQVTNKSMKLPATQSAAAPMEDTATH
jgi:hypothetical protein